MTYHNNTIMGWLKDNESRYFLPVDTLYRHVIYIGDPQFTVGIKIIRREVLKSDRHTTQAIEDECHQSYRQ